MFTGIISHLGTISNISGKGDLNLTINCDRNYLKQVALGASISCSGICLTVTSSSRNSFNVQVSKETISRTNIGVWKIGDKINLERALKVGDELGGHFVSGHIDSLAKIKNIKKIEDCYKFTLSVKKPYMKYIIEKGSVCLDGISLTVNKVTKDSFNVNIIPHTLKNTTLANKKTGDKLNLEIDIIARYLIKDAKTRYDK